MVTISYLSFRIAVLICALRQVYCGGVTLYSKNGSASSRQLRMHLTALQAHLETARRALFILPSILMILGLAGPIF